MEQKGRDKKKKIKTRNLNVILWVTFSLFSVVIIAIFAVVQNFLTERQYREQVLNELREAGGVACRMISESGGTDGVVFAMITVSKEYGVIAYLFTADGKYVYPDAADENASEIIGQIREALGGRKDISVTYRPSVNTYAYARAVTVGGVDCYLYLTRALSPFSRFSGDVIWLSVITMLFSVAFAFVVSGFVSMLITKPISEVTQKAKDLARGNYDVKFGGRYFCTEACELSEALEHAGEEISRADKMQKELIANVSHDFKTPLTMIKAYASMIREISGDDAEKREKHTQIIIDESDRLAALVGDLLDLSKMQAGIDQCEKTVFNLSEEVYRVTKRFDYMVETQGYSILTDIDDDLYTFAGKERVEQVLYNLIGNAINYTGEDKKVFIRLKQGALCSRFEVIDTGKGIPPEEIDTIWERYYRSSEAHKRPVRGTGLGLSIVKTILTRHKIAFGVQSEVGKGSCFWVEFPLPPEEDSLRRNAADR